MQPWLVYLTVSVAPAVKAGYDPGSGIDRVLQDEAKAAGKPVKGLETMGEQMHLVADLPMADQVALLHEELAELPKSVGQMDEIVGDWTAGDVVKISALDHDELKVKHPALYDKMLVKRKCGLRLGDRRDADVAAGGERCLWRWGRRTWRGRTAC